METGNESLECKAVLYGGFVPRDGDMVLEAESCSADDLLRLPVTIRFAQRIGRNFLGIQEAAELLQGLATKLSDLLFDEESGELPEDEGELPALTVMLLASMSDPEPGISVRLDLDVGESTYIVTIMPTVDSAVRYLVSDYSNLMYVGGTLTEAFTRICADDIAKMLGELLVADSNIEICDENNGEEEDEL